MLYHWTLLCVRYNFIYNWCKLWHKFKKIAWDLLVNKGISGSGEKMLGAGEPSAKRAIYHKQKIYNEKRKEKPRKPQFNLNFQFNFREEEEMQATSARFVRLRNMANLRSGRTNADFLQVVMDWYEGKTLEKSTKENDVAVQAVLQLYTERQIKIKDFGCQWPSGELEGPACMQILSPAHDSANYFVCRHESLITLLQATARGRMCGCPYVYDGAHMNIDGHVLRMECCCEKGDHRTKWASSSIIGSKYAANCR